MTDVVVSVLGVDDGRERERLTEYLLGEIAQLPVDTVTRASDGPAPEGARAAGELGSALLVKLAPELVKKLVGVVRSWLSRSGAREVEIAVGETRLRIVGASKAHQDEMLAVFLEAVRTGTPRDAGAAAGPLESTSS